MKNILILIIIITAIIITGCSSTKPQKKKIWSYDEQQWIEETTTFTFDRVVCGSHK